MPELFLTGTCSECKTRFRMKAKEIIKKNDLFCSGCGKGLNVHYLKTMAIALLTQNKNKK